MQKNYLLALPMATILWFLSAGSADIWAGTIYTFEQVSSHNTSTDCWVTFEGDIYDISGYISPHDRFMDIRSWCGEDMTEAFTTKDGTGEDHRSQTYTLLASYKIGALSTTETMVISSDNPNQTTTSAVTNSATPSATNTVSDTTVKTAEAAAKTKNPYNFWLPFLATVMSYLLSWVLVKKGKLNRVKFNAVWNTLLGISLLPSALFGLYLILSYTFPDLRRVTFDFLYWHVEGSIVFATIAFSHLITRWQQYRIQLKAFNS